VIVQDAYHPTETTRFADILLPAAQWPEKEGVMTNSERRLTYLPKLVDPPGEALPDAVIIGRFAAEMGWKEAFSYDGAAQIFDEFAALTTGTPCDCSGVSHARLRRDGPLQWPVPAADHPGTARLYTDGRFATASGRARFVAVEHAEPAEPVDASFPLTLTTGRVRDHWHTLTRGHSPALMRRTPEPILELNPGDARRAAVGDGEFVEITSRRGKAVAQARVTGTIREGTCFLPFHWGRRLGFYKAANNLTLSARDPLSHQPELKACAVRIRAVAVVVGGEAAGETPDKTVVGGEAAGETPDKVVVGGEAAGETPDKVVVGGEAAGETPDKTVVGGEAAGETPVPRIEPGAFEKT